MTPDRSTPDRSTLHRRTLHRRTLHRRTLRRPRLGPAALAALSICALLAAPIALPAPLPPEQRGPVDVRRVTLVVRDVERSLPLYRDALGLSVVYDQLIGSATDASGRKTPPTIRLVLLRANDDFVGLIGLMQRLNEKVPPPLAVTPDTRAQAGQPILVVNAKDLESRFARIAAVPGITVATPPTPVEYPSPTGGTIPVLFSAVWDPDGFFVEINQLRGTAAGTEKQPASKESGAAAAKQADAAASK